jgi:hypothetical protein
VGTADHGYHRVQVYTMLINENEFCLLDVSVIPLMPNNPSYSGIPLFHRKFSMKTPLMTLSRHNATIEQVQHA